VVVAPGHPIAHLGILCSGSFLLGILEVSATIPWTPFLGMVFTVFQHFQVEKRKKPPFRETTTGQRMPPHSEQSFHRVPVTFTCTRRKLSKKPQGSDKSSGDMVLLCHRCGVSD